MIDHDGSHTRYDGENRAIQVFKSYSHTWLTYDAADNLAGNTVRAENYGYDLITSYDVRYQKQRSYIWVRYSAKYDEEMNKEKIYRKQLLSNQKDKGALRLRDQTIEGIRFEACALSNSREERSCFQNCQFINLESRKSVIGAAIFESCSFHNIIEEDLIVLYSALFLECKVSGKLSGFNIGFVDDKLYLKELIEDNIRRAREVAFCLDVSDADLDNISFVGEEIADKVRLRSGQCLIMYRQNGFDADKLRERIKTIKNEGLKCVMAQAYRLRNSSKWLCSVPHDARPYFDELMAILKEHHISVHFEPLC